MNIYHPSEQKSPDRRQFLATLTAGAAGLLGQMGCAGNQPVQLAQQIGGRPIRTPNKSQVEFRAGKDRYKIIYDALMPFQKQVAEDIGDKQVVIKANCALINMANAFCSTDKDELRAILEFLKPIHDGQIIIAEGTASQASSIMPAYENYGYMPLQDQYNIRFEDANLMPTKIVHIHSYKQQPVPINVNYTYMDPNVYLISAARLKTHDTIVATASLKNVVMGAPQCRFWEERSAGRSDKPLMHGATNLQEIDRSGQELSYNLFTLALAGVRPDLAVIDGVESVQGNGPWSSGEMLEHGVVVVSTDFVAADRIGVELMGIDPFYMKYVEWCGDAGLGNYNSDNISVNGPNYQNHIIKYRLHENVAEQMAWIDKYYTR